MSRFVVEREELIVSRQPHEKSALDVHVVAYDPQELGGTEHIRDSGEIATLGSNLTREPGDISRCESQANGLFLATRGLDVATKLLQDNLLLISGEELKIRPADNGKITPIGHKLKAFNFEFIQCLADCSENPGIIGLL
ncbi:MAG: hypothetical protein ACREQK_13340 [Candidatus Binatia bacterium]